jgi:hypothetical protein
MLVMLMGVIEYGFIMNGLLSIDYATRDAALIAAEAGNGAGADCVIIAKVQSEVTAPANAANIQKIQIYWTDASGQPLDTSGNPTTIGSANQAVDTYVPGGSTTCTLADSTNVTIPYQLQGTATYPEDNRCNVVRGCDLLWSGVNVHHPGLDTIGVLVQYTDTWKTPLHTLIGLMGPGWSATQSNEMRMEPVL